MTTSSPGYLIQAGQDQFNKNLYWSNDYTATLVNNASIRTMKLTNNATSTFEINPIKKTGYKFIISHQLKKYLRWDLDTVTGFTYITASSIDSTKEWENIDPATQAHLKFISSTVDNKNDFRLQTTDSGNQFLKRVFTTANNWYYLDGQSERDIFGVFTMISPS